MTGPRPAGPFRASAQPTIWFHSESFKTKVNLWKSGFPQRVRQACQATASRPQVGRAPGRQSQEGRASAHRRTPRRNVTTTKP